MSQFFPGKKTNYAAVFHDDDNGLMRVFISLKDRGSMTIVKNFLSSPLTMPENLQMVMDQLWKAYAIPFNNINTKLATLTLANPSRSDSLQPRSFHPASWTFRSAVA